MNYFREKLGITDDNEALTLINKWNLGPLPRYSYKDSFSIGEKRFGLLKDSNKIIVMANYGDRPAYINNVLAGRGGYLWQYLQNSKLQHDATTCELLKNRFCLKSKYDQDRFIKL